MTTREKFLLIVQTMAIVRDIKRDKHIAEHIVHAVLEMPDYLLNFEESGKESYYTAALELIDFEYGLLEKEDYSDWLKKYLTYRFKGNLKL